MPINFTPDVIVCGAGCAGIAAALSAARNGARTVLVERAGFAGGIITTVGLPFFDGIARKHDKKIIHRGIGLELLSRMGVCRMSDQTVYAHNPVIRSTERFKILLDEMITAEPNLQVLYHSFVADVTTRGDRIDEVLVANKGGIQRFRAKTVVDCTGDADVAWRSGTPYETSPEYMPMTLHFRIGNVVNNTELRQKCRDVLVQAHKEGKLANYYGPGVSFMFANNEVYLHAIRVPADPIDPLDLTRAEMQGRKDAWTMFELWKEKVPGFENSYYITSGPYIGIRESRRIVGQYVLTENDIKEEKKFPDAIATGCWYLDLHPNYATTGSANVKPGALGGLDGYQPDHYDIPYRSLVPKKIANLLVAGRCHSATRLAQSSSRVTVTAMAMGQAAGSAAAIALESNKTVAELDGAKVRAALDRIHAGPFAG